MNTLYININGDDIKGTENMTVVGKPKDAIINKFYFELVKGIVKGVTVPGIGEVKKKNLVTDFEANNAKAFAKITEQWDLVKQALLGENPDVTFKVALPQEYVEWLYNHSDSRYNKVAESLASRGYAVEINIGNIYRNGLLILVYNIDTDKKYGQFVVSDALVDDDSAIAVAIRKRIGVDVPFVPFVDWDDNQDDPEKCPNCGKNPCECVPTNPFIYDEIEGFHEGLARVKRDGLYGFIDYRGCEVISCEYEYAEDEFENGYCNVRVKKDDDSGDYLYGVIDHKGEKVLPCVYQDTIEYDADGFWCVQNDKIGWVDKKGITMVPFIWDELGGHFKEGVALVRKTDCQWNFVNKQGTIVSRLPAKYGDVHWDDMYKGIFPVEMGGKWGCIDSNLNAHVDFVYDHIKLFDPKEGYFRVSKDGLEGIMNYRGEEIVKCRYYRIWAGGTFAPLENTKNGSIHLYNVRKNRILGTYKSFYMLGWSQEGYFAPVAANGFSCLIDENGNTVISPNKYKRLGIPWEGLIIAELYDEESAKWYKDDDDFDERDYEIRGMIDLEGNEVIPFIYEDLSKPENGFIVAKYNGKYCVINSKNELVFANNVDEEEWKQACENGYV